MAVAVSISPRNSAISQPARLRTIRANPIVMYGSSSASDPPIRWMSRVAVASATSSMSSIVTMPISMPVVSVTGSADPVVLAEDADGVFLAVARLERDEPAIHQLGYLPVERRQQELANPHVVDQEPAFVDDVDDVERFAVLAVRAHVVEHLAHGPVLPHRDIVRRHQAADRLLGIAEQRHRDGAFAGREQCQQLTGDFGGAAPPGTACGRPAPCC